MEVFDDQRERLRAAFLEQEPFHRVLNPLPLLGRIQTAPGRIVDGDVEQGEQRRATGREVFAVGQDRAGDLLADRFRRVGIVDHEVTSQQLADREPRRRRPVGDAAAAEHAPVVHGPAPGELVDEA